MPRKKALSHCWERAFEHCIKQSEQIRRAPELPSQQRRRGERDLDDAGVAAVAVSVLGADLIKQLLCNIFLGDVGINLTLGVQVACLAKLIIFSAMERTSLARVTSGLNLAIL